jgi:hypothetical protein
MAALPALSQYSFYFGKNKVIKQKYDWNQIETEHFKIHYYTQRDSLIKKLAAASEKSYKQISDYLNIKVKKKIPLIFYTTHIDFEMNNIAGYLPPGVIAFAESTTYRVVIQGDAPFPDLVETITHELAHIFEYTIMGNRARYFRPPLWLIEGFADFVTNQWNQFNLLTVRDAVLTGDIPVLTKNGELQSRGYNNRSPYDFGHMVYEFLDKKYGKRGVKKLLYSLRGGSLFRTRGNPLKIFDLTPKLFNYEFGKYLRQRFNDFKNRENPEDYSYIIGPDFPYAYTFSHEISPSGEMLAILTANMKIRQLTILLISMKDGKVIKNLMPGITTDYDWINLNFNPTGGPSFTWNKASNEIAFFARYEWDNYLILLDVLKGKITKKIKITGIQQPTSPNYHPRNPRLLYFTGQEATNSFIYSINLDTKKVNKHTDGLMFIRAIDIAKDGERIVFSALKDDHYKIFLGRLEKPEMAKQLTTGEYNDITPTFTANGRKIYYSSDERGSYNIYSIDLDEKKLSRYTDVQTGNFFPLEIPEDKDHVVMSSYYKSTFLLFKKDITKPQEERFIEFETLDIDELARKVAAVPEVDIKFQGDYKPLSKLFIQSLPPLSVAVGTDGGFFGQSYLSLTDLVGDHVFSLLISSYYGYRSYHLTYLDQGSRLQLFAHLFAFRDVYYYSGFIGSNYLTLRSQYGAELGFFYPFNRSYRAEATVALYKQNENLDNIYYGGDLPFGQFFDGYSVPLRISLVGETTRFMNTGPLMGHTFRLSFSKYIKFGDKFLDAYAAEGEFRKYFRLSNDALVAFRLYGYKSGGRNALLYWTGGNNTLRGAGFRRLVGNNIALFNAEFRFPLVRAALTPIGLIGPVRGVFFFDVGGVWFNGQDFNIFKKDDEGKRTFQLQDAISSYGFGLEFFLFGYPMHVDWVWKTDWKYKSYYGATFWIGFDF